MRRYGKSVTMSVDPDFHKRIDDERKRIEQVYGRPFTNTMVTRILANKGTIKMPKMKRGFEL